MQGWGEWGHRFFFVGLSKFGVAPLKMVSILPPCGGPRNHLPYTKTPRLNWFLSTPLNLALGGPWEGAPPMQVSFLAD